MFRECMQLSHSVFPNGLYPTNPRFKYWKEVKSFKINLIQNTVKNYVGRMYACCCTVSSSTFISVMTVITITDISKLTAAISFTYYWLY